MSLPLHAKEYVIAILFCLSHLHLVASTASLSIKTELCNFPGIGQCVVGAIWPFLGQGELVRMWLMLEVLISTDAAGQRSDPYICLGKNRHRAKGERQRADHRTDWHHLPLLSPEADAPWRRHCDFRGVREGVAKPVPEAASGKWTVSCEPFVLSFILTLEMKGTDSIP